MTGFESQYTLSTNDDPSVLVRAVQRSLAAGGEKGLNYHGTRKELTSFLLLSSPAPGPISFGLSCLQQACHSDFTASNLDSLIHLILASLEGVRIVLAKPQRESLQQEHTSTASSSSHGFGETTLSDVPAVSDGDNVLQGQEVPENLQVVIDGRTRDMQKAQQTACELAWGAIVSSTGARGSRRPGTVSESQQHEEQFDYSRIRPRQLMRLLAVGNIDMQVLQSYVNTLQKPDHDYPNSSSEPNTGSHAELPDLPMESSNQGAGRDLSVADEGVRAYLRALVARKAYPAAVGLMQQLQISEESSAAFLVDMVDRGQVNLAADWANCLGVDAVRGLVAECNRRDNFKGSWKIVERLGMEKEFPNAFLLYRQR